MPSEARTSGKPGTFDPEILGRTAMALPLLDIIIKDKGDKGLRTSNRSSST